MPSLPRVNLAAKAISSDLGSYNLFTCTGAGPSRSCTFNTDFANDAFSGGVYTGLTGSKTAGTVLEYAEVRTDAGAEEYVRAC